MTLRRSVLVVINILMSVFIDIPGGIGTEESAVKEEEEEEALVAIPVDEVCLMFVWDFVDNVSEICFCIPLIMFLLT